MDGTPELEEPRPGEQQQDGCRSRGDGQAIGQAAAAALHGRDLPRHDGIGERPGDRRDGMAAAGATCQVDQGAPTRRAIHGAGGERRYRVVVETVRGARLGPGLRPKGVAQQIERIGIRHGPAVLRGA